MVLLSLIKTLEDKYDNAFFMSREKREQKEMEKLINKEYNEEEYKLALVLAIIADTYGNKYNEIKNRRML